MAFKRFTRFGLVEVLIFTGVCVGFGHSVYRLIRQGSGVAPGPVFVEKSTSSASPMAQFLEREAIFTYELKCSEAPQVIETTARELRLVLNDCPQVGRALASLTKPGQIENLTTQHVATVFTQKSQNTENSDQNNGLSFSTDFIPLAIGVNRIQMQIKNLPKEITVVRR